MKIGILTFQERVAPRFDKSRSVTIVNAEDQGKVLLNLKKFRDISTENKIHDLISEDVGVLICSSIKESNRDLLKKAGITVIPDVIGPVSKVIKEMTNGDFGKNASLSKSNKR